MHKLVSNDRASPLLYSVSQYKRPKLSPIYQQQSQRPEGTVNMVRLNLLSLLCLLSLVGAGISQIRIRLAPRPFCAMLRPQPLVMNKTEADPDLKERFEAFQNDWRQSKYGKVTLTYQQWMWWYSLGDTKVMCNYFYFM